jgi:crossover junction endodeoxyribonuclease RuvC
VPRTGKTRTITPTKAIADPFSAPAALLDSGVVIGVDPGSYKTGYGALRRQGVDVWWIRSGRLRPPRNLRLPLRLAWLHETFGSLLDELTPKAVAFETSFVGRNLRAALTLGQARGALITAASSRGIPVQEFSPAEVKLAVTGYGTASKEQIQDMVPRLIGGMEHDPVEDEADALAVALCCLHHQVREGWRDLASSWEAR